MGADLQALSAGLAKQIHPVQLLMDVALPASLQAAVEPPLLPAAGSASQRGRVEDVGVARPVKRRGIEMWGRCKRRWCSDPEVIPGGGNEAS